MARARRALELALRLEAAVAVAAFAFMAAILFADVLGRELAAAGIYWAPRAAVYAMITTASLGMVLASASGSHLRPRFAEHWAEDWLPASWQPAMRRAPDLLTGAFCLGFAAVAAGYVRETYQLGDTALGLDIAVWIFQLPLGYAFLSVGVRHVLYAVYPELSPSEAARP